MTKDQHEILKIVKEAGAITKKYFGHRLKINRKGTPADYQTRADVESEKHILKRINKNFPGCNIHSEENGKTGRNSEYLFIIDPLDGTNNFVLGIPNFSVSVALLKGGKAVFSAVYNPMIDSLYFAARGKGAYLNKKKIKVSKVSDIHDSTVCYSCGYKESIIYSKLANKYIRKLESLKVKRILDNWSSALDYCLLASGKIESIINNNNKIYDFSAGKLIAREAGAIITDFDGDEEKSEKNRVFLASNGQTIHGKILEVI